MLQDFTYYNPTKIYFGKGSLANLQGELANYGETVLLAYGRNAIKSAGLYDQVVAILTAAGKKIVELSGIMPNPTNTKMMEGAALVRQHNVDLIPGCWWRFGHRLCQGDIRLCLLRGQSL